MASCSYIYTIFLSLFFLFFYFYFYLVSLASTCPRFEVFQVFDIVKASRARGSLGHLRPGSGNSVYRTCTYSIPNPSLLGMEAGFQRQGSHGPSYVSSYPLLGSVLVDDILALGFLERGLRSQLFPLKNSIVQRSLPWINHIDDCSTYLLRRRIGRLDWLHQISAPKLPHKPIVFPQRVGGAHLLVPPYI